MCQILIRRIISGRHRRIETPTGALRRPQDGCRGILLDFIGSRIGDGGVTTPLPDYMGKSIRDLLVHSAGCYFHWLAYLAMRQPYGSLSEEATTMSELQRLYARVDATMALFLYNFFRSMLV